MDLQHPPEEFLDACSPWLSLPGPEADWLETCPDTSAPISPGDLDAAAEASDLSADTQERCLWTLAVVDSQTGKALRPVTRAEAQAVWVPQPVSQPSGLVRGDSQLEPIPSSEARPEQVTSEEGSSPPSPGLPTRGLSDSLERQTSVASQLSKIGGPCQHCGVKGRVQSDSTVICPHCTYLLAAQLRNEDCTASYVLKPVGQQVSPGDGSQCL